MIILESDQDLPEIEHWVPSISFLFFGSGDRTRDLEFPEQALTLPS